VPIVAGAVDGVYRIMPDALTLSGLAAGLTLASLDGEPGPALAGEAVASAVSALLYLLCPGVPGLGGVQLAPLAGVAIGLQGVPIALPTGILIRGPCGVVLLLACPWRWAGSLGCGAPLPGWAPEQRARMRKRSERRFPASSPGTSAPGQGDPGPGKEAVSVGTAAEARDRVGRQPSFEGPVCVLSRHRARLVRFGSRQVTRQHDGTGRPCRR
jgi:hypothetical protein